MSLDRDAQQPVRPWLRVIGAVAFLILMYLVLFKYPGFTEVLRRSSEFGGAN